MKRSGTWVTLLVIGIVLAGCGPSRPTTEQAGAAGSGAATGSVIKILTVPLEGEPRDPLLTSMFGGSGTIAGDLKPAVHQKLASYDERGALLPQLAVELPAQDRGTWTLRPDGTMQTRYALRSDVLWHDGTRLTAKDFVFGWTIMRDPELPMATRFFASQISAIDTPDDFTLVIEWSNANPLANAIVEDDLGPAPMHLLDQIYRTEKERFPQLPFWTHEFVGVGPYQLTEWVAGSHLTLKAFDGFYGGRAKIDTIVFRFIPNDATVMANLLAGSIDGAFAGMTFEQMVFVKNEWERAGRKPTFVPQTTHWQIMGIQFRNPQTQDILDPRVRRGLLNALDRQALTNALYDGLAPVSDWFIPRDDVKWQWVQDVIVRYEHDPRRAEQWFTEAGWRRGQDGMFSNAAGERVVFPFWGGSGEQGERETAIIADSWKTNGVGIEQIVRAQELQQDLRFRATFPALETTSIPIKFPGTVQRVHGPRCPTEQTRWSGGNRGCYQNAAMDRAVDALLMAVDPAEQRLLYRDLVKMQTEDLPLLPLYFKVNSTLFREGVTGVRGDTQPRTSVLWNVAEWDIR